jgi:hypothetical protein
VLRPHCTALLSIRNEVLRVKALVVEHLTAAELLPREEPASYSMRSSNITRARQYLEAVASGESVEKRFEFYSPDVVIEEFPNRIAPQGRVRRAADIRAAYQHGQKILRSQSYNVQRIVESGGEVAVELEWTGVLAVPVMGLPAGAR